MIRVLPALLELGLLLFCLIECIQAPEAEVRNLPRWAWMILIILIPLVGGIAWLVAGRPLRSARSGRPAAWPSPRTSEYPRSTQAPRGPDDDAEFLAKIHRPDAGQDDALRRWEEDLRHPEDEPKGRPPGSGDDEEPPAITP